MKATKKTTTLALFLIAVFIAALPTKAVGLPGDKTHEIDCNKGETITGALRKAEPGDTIKIAGLCREQVVIDTDQLTLAGVSGATIQGGSFKQPSAFSGLVTVNGARGVRLIGLQVQGSQAEGVLGVRGAAFSIDGLTVQDNGSDAVAVTEGSSLELSNSTLRRSFVGLDVFTGSNAVLRGAVTISDNGTDVGLFIGGASAVEIRGAQVQVTGNKTGVVVEGSSHLGFYTFPGEPGKGSSLLVSANLELGMVVLNSTVEVFTESVRITSSHNPVGILAIGGAISSPFGIEKGIVFTLENNDVGLDLEQGANALIVGGLNVRNNKAVGILADNSSITMVGAPPNPSTVTGNGVDLDFRFGSRVTADGVTFSSKKCEASVLARGVPTCP